jgi:Uma2 family endonuclease
MVSTKASPATDTGYRIDPDLEPDLSHIETEDETPVDNVIAERQHRLLVEALYAGWNTEEPFVAMTNVGLFYGVKLPPLVPDMLLSMGVTPPPHLSDYTEKRNRAYFIWEYGKAPDLVIEVVSNFKGEELGEKLTKYASLGIEYYVVYDPLEEYGKPPLRAFVRHARGYTLLDEAVFPEIGLRLGMWYGTYQGIEGEWLRWFTADGELIVNAEELDDLLTQERALNKRTQAELLDQRKRAQQAQKRMEQERQKAEQERQKAEQERQKAEQERQRANDAEARAEALAAKLRALGIEP